MSEVIYQPKAARYMVQHYNNTTFYYYSGTETSSKIWTNIRAFSKVDKAKEYALKYKNENPDLLVRVVDNEKEK